MNLQEQIKSEMVVAMKARETEKLGILRVISGELTTNSKRPEKEKLDELQIIRKMSNNAKEMGNDAEVLILENYLPKMLGELQVRTIVAGIIQINKYSGMQDMGKVMGTLKTHPMTAQIDGKLASQITRELLTQ